MAKLDGYTRRNWAALSVVSTHGHSELNGLSRTTIRAMARRGLVHDLGGGRASLTPAGTAALAELDGADS